jgi:hypothetical protein
MGVDMMATYRSTSGSRYRFVDQTPTRSLPTEIRPHGSVRLFSWANVECMFLHLGRPISMSGSQYGKFHSRSDDVNARPS